MALYSRKQGELNTVITDDIIHIPLQILFNFLQGGSINEGFEGDSAISDEYSASALSRNSQIVEFVEEASEEDDGSEVKTSKV